MAKKMYFDEAHVKELVTRFQNEMKKSDDGGYYCDDKQLEKEIVSNLMLIVNAIINKYSFWLFDTVDELRQEAIAECWKALPTFNPEKGTCFNLFSLICKYHLIQFTVKQKNNRMNADIDIHPEVAYPEDHNFDLFLEDLETLLLKGIAEKYPEKYDRYIKLTAVLMEYLYKNHAVLGKNDLIAAFKSYGFRASEFKEFIKDIEVFKEQAYELAK